MCTANGWSRWGCIWDGPRENIATEITDGIGKGNILFPDASIPRQQNSWFTLPGYNGETDDYLTYTNLINSTYIEKDAELRIWFTQDLLDYAESDNVGHKYVDVYAKISK